MLSAENSGTAEATGSHGPKLSERQLRVAELAAEGYPNREIASTLKLTEQVVKNVLRSVFDKLGVWNRVELANYFSKGTPQEVQQMAKQRMEAERIAELKRRQILDTKAERVLDELTNVAATVFDVPIALVAMVDRKRVWFKSKVGVGLSQIMRDMTACKDTIQQSQVLVIPDTKERAGACWNPLVWLIGVRFYAAAPILTEDGYALGVVCIVDYKPREFSDSQLAVLPSLAKIALEHIERGESGSEKLSG